MRQSGPAMRLEQCFYSSFKLVLHLSLEVPPPSLDILEINSYSPMKLPLAFTVRLAFYDRRLTQHMV